MGGYWQLVFVCCLLVQSLSAEDSAKDNSISPVNDNSTSVVNDNVAPVVNDDPTSAVNTDEELEKNVGQRIASLREMGRNEIRNFADLALGYFNLREESVFTNLEDTTVTVKKAIGSMIYLQMTVEKTNCTKKDMKYHSFLSISRRLHSENKEPPKFCGPLPGEDKKQLDCKFDMFKDERSYGEAVVSHDCKQVKVIDKSFIFPPKIPN